MTRSSTRLVLAAWVALVVSLSAHSPTAAQTAIAGASEDQQTVARAAYAEGVEAFERAEYARALERFDAADKAVSSPNVKLMRARCLAQLGKPAEAYEMYSATVSEAKASGEPRYEASAAAAAEEAVALETKIALLTLTVNDETGDAVLEINGAAVPRRRWSEAMPLAPGAVTITLSGADGQRDSDSRTLAAGTRAAVELTLAAPAAQPVAEAPSTLTPPVTASGDPAHGRSLPVLPIVLGAAGGVGLIAFGVLGAMSNSELNTLETGCPSHRDCDPELADAASNGRTYQTAANISLGAGLLLLAAGTTLFVIDLSSENLEVALTPNGARLRGAL
jgi:hypothetical protein